MNTDYVLDDNTSMCQALIMTEEKKSGWTPRAFGGPDIRSEREQRGWSQSQLAERAGTTQQTVDRIERGLTQFSRALPAILRALEVSPVETEKTLRVALHNQVAIEARSSDDDDITFDGFLQNQILSSQVPVFGNVVVDQRGEYNLLVVDYIPRSYPIEKTRGAFAVVVDHSNLSPTIRIGEVVVCNPNIPPSVNTDVFISSVQDSRRYGRCAELGMIGEAELLLKTTVEDRMTRLRRGEWDRMDTIVAKYYRVR